MYTINILNDERIVKACTVGALKAGDMNDARRKIAALCKEHHINKVLVDDRAVTSCPSFEDLYQFGATFLDNGLPFYIKIAHVVNSATLSDNEFLETVAVNRGANVKTFQNMEDALQWLNI